MTRANTRANPTEAVAGVSSSTVMDPAVMTPKERGMEEEEQEEDITMLVLQDCLGLLSLLSTNFFDMHFFEPLYEMILKYNRTLTTRINRSQTQPGNAEQFENQFRVSSQMINEPQIWAKVINYCHKTKENHQAPPTYSLQHDKSHPVTCISDYGR